MRRESLPFLFYVCAVLFAAPLSWSQPVAGDVDGSGAVNAVDVQLVINGALGLPVEFNTDVDYGASTDAIDVQLIINAALGLGIDSDGDGLCDGAEANLGTDPNKADSDEDGLSDGEEVIVLKCDPMDRDSDDDGLSDGEETDEYGTDPADDDSDDDGVPDGQEVWSDTDPMNPDDTPSEPDSDEDGLPDNAETETQVFVDESDTGSDPFDPDSDDDGLMDGEEVHVHGTDPNDDDSDDDGVPDGVEIEHYETDPNDADSDNDGLTDGEEVNTHSTDPNLQDSDEDGLTDGEEVNDTGTSPTKNDTDEDGLDDGSEIDTHGTDPSKADSDEDGLPDGDEVNEWGTNPLLEDTDEDTFGDGHEVWSETDPLDPHSFPQDPDTDEDGLPDTVETGTGVYGGPDDTGTDPNNSDTDHDGLPDGVEVMETGTDPTDEDSDDDGLLDGWELEHELDPKSDAGDNGAGGDPDEDGLTNEEEQALGTDPRNPDTDGDGLPDGWEVDHELSPTDPTGANGAGGDPDDDGLPNIVELEHETNPNAPDTDHDGMPDGWELENRLDPNNDAGEHGASGDPDGDGLPNGDEFGHETDPRNPDTDNDGLTDGDEVNVHGTNPNSNDSDQDGLGDEEEVNSLPTDPLLGDTDEDGLSDGEEVHETGTDPLDADSDDDTLPDGWEVVNELDPWNACCENGYCGDDDNDGLINFEELALNTHPRNPDTDEDGMPDGWEVDTQGVEWTMDLLDPTTDDAAGDQDGDGLLNGDEFAHECNPYDADSDHDGHEDSEEIANGWGPRDPYDPVDILYVRDTDEAAAVAFEALLQSWGMRVVVVTRTGLPSLKSFMDEFDVTIVGDDTGYDDTWGTTDQVNALQPPILGIGQGGYALFGKLGLPVGYPNGAHGTATEVLVADGEHMAFKNPNDLGVTTGNSLEVVGSALLYEGIDLSSSPSGVVGVADNDAGTEVYPLVYDRTGYFLWGFSSTPSQMTAVGKQLFENVVRYAARPTRITGSLSFDASITSPPTPSHPAHVWGWSESGAWAETDPDFATGYSLEVADDQVWHVGGVYEDLDNGQFYESTEDAISVPAGAIEVVHDIELQGPYLMPQPLIVSFDASQMQTIVLPDAVKMVIPAGALVPSGTATLFIFPTEAPNEVPCRMGLGYEFWATDQNGQEITSFAGTLTITAPLLSRAILEAQGLPPEASLEVIQYYYYSTREGRWISAEQTVLDEGDMEVTLTLSHF